MNNNTISVVFADSSHAHYAPRICDLIYESALQRGTGIAKRIAKNLFSLRKTHSNYGNFCTILIF